MKGRKNESRLSKPIVIISLASIIIGVAVMIVSVSVVTGFQEAIRNKVIGFGSHISITKEERTASMESSAIIKDQEFYPSLEEEPGVKNIQVFAYKPAILQSFRDSVAFESNGADTIRPRRDIMGVIFKGIDEDYDWEFFEDKLVEGEVLDFSSEHNEVLISAFVATKMGFEVGSELEAHFIIDNIPRKRKFKVKGIYRTGFEEFDKQYIFTQIHHIQKLNNWGIQTLLTVKDTCINNKFVLKGISIGGNRNYKYKWNGEYIEQDYYLIDGIKDTSLLVTSTDFEMGIFGPTEQPASIPDTAIATIKIDSACSCSSSLLALEPIRFESESLIRMPFGIIEVQNGKGTFDQYVGGFEVLIEDWDDLEKLDDIIYNEKIPNTLKSLTIVDRYESIFTWLDILDINIIIIITLILVVSLINMVTSLLVIILEKTNMVGILKALGATNSSIRKIFMYNSMFLLSRGLIWGNLIGIGLILFQHFTGFISLNPEEYNLDYAPVSLNIWNFIWINLLTIAICRLTLILPSLVVSRINPIKAIRFD